MKKQTYNGNRINFKSIVEGREAIPFEGPTIRRHNTHSHTIYRKTVNNVTKQVTTNVIAEVVDHYRVLNIPFNAKNVDHVIEQLNEQGVYGVSVAPYTFWKDHRVFPMNLIRVNYSVDFR